MINATSGISCTQNVRFISGISAISGIKGTLPLSYQAYYPFISDFQDQVSADYIALSNNAPSFGGGGINTVANTNLKLTTFQDDGKGVYLDEPGQSGSIPCVCSARTDASFTNGINPTSNRIDLNVANGGSPKYSGLAVVPFINSIWTSSTGNEVIRIIGIQSPGLVLNYEILKGLAGNMVAAFGNDGTNSNPFTIDFSYSDYFPTETGAGSVSELRFNAGDDVSVFSTSVQWDTSGDFRFGYIGIGKTVSDITSQVLLQTGNMGITTGIGITFAEIGASISSLAVTSNTIVGECFIKYVGGMLSIVIDGVESTPVASAAPAIGSFAQAGANISNMLAAPGTYGGLLFEVL